MGKVGLGWIMLVALLLGACTTYTDGVKDEDPEEDPEEVVAAEAEAEEEKAKEAEEAERKKKEAEEKKAREAEEAKKKEEEAKAKEEAEKAEKEQEEASQGILEEMALGLLQDSFEGTGDVDFIQDSKMFTVTPTDSAFTMEILMMLEGTKGLDDWNNLTETMATLSSSFSELLGEGYSVALVNPINTDNYLILAMEGVVLYDAFNE